MFMYDSHRYFRRPPKTGVVRPSPHSVIFAKPLPKGTEELTAVPAGVCLGSELRELIDSHTLPPEFAGWRPLAVVPTPEAERHLRRLSKQLNIPIGRAADNKLPAK